MNNTVKEWLKELYNGAIEDAKGTIANERIWANGANGDEETQMHLDNINLNEEYIAELERLRDDLDGIVRAKQELNTDGMTGYLLEFLDEKTGTWKPSEIANPFNVRVWDLPAALHDWEKDEVKIGMFANYPTAWGDVAGDDWDCRLGVNFNWKHPAEGKGVSTELNEFYRIRKVELGPFSEKFLEFCKNHPEVEVTKDYEQLGE